MYDLSLFERTIYFVSMSIPLPFNVLLLWQKNNGSVFVYLLWRTVSLHLNLFLCLSEELVNFIKVFQSILNRIFLHMTFLSLYLDHVKYVMSLHSKCSSILICTPFKDNLRKLFWWLHNLTSIWSEFKLCNLIMLSYLWNIVVLQILYL